MRNVDYFNAEYQKNRDEWLFADSDNDGSGSESVSVPYIIQIVNACTSAIADVDIGDSYANRAGTSAGPWNFNQNSNITITSTVSGVTYIEFLAESESKPFKVGRTMIISATAGQFNQTAAVTHRDAAGNRMDHVIVPTIDPYQNQTDRILDEYEYLFDGFTRLRFRQINGSATVTTRLYKVSNFSATQIVAGRSGERQFKAPHIIKFW